MIIDTNVLVSADHRSPQTPEHCVTRCIDVIAQAQTSIVALDAGDLILSEYGKNVSMAAPFGVGTQFVRFLYQQQWNVNRCERIVLTPHDDRVFEEFPDDPRLANFDPADRKFVATAIASAQHHEVFNAVDSDWAAVDEALQEYGVNVVYLCPSFTSP
jgi:hypothetical protein